METIKFIFIFLLSVLVSCNNSTEKSVNNRKPVTKELADLNSYFVQKDKERIQNYIERKSLDMNESPSGLWYRIIKEGSGVFFKENDTIMMDYECSLLDGTICYSSKKLGLKRVVLGNGELEAGLNEGLRLLKPGGEAIFILPPFVAFGLIGDGKAVPPRATLVYEIKILNRK
jgi:FKBP-type peptidyl-prolyl cis-trans isomerase FkpA